MSILFHCPSCRKGLSVSEKRAGQRARCRQCSNVLVVPSAAALAESSISHGGGGVALQPIAFRCPSCARGLSIPQTRAGARVRCPRCRQGIIAPGGSAPAPKVSRGEEAIQAVPRAVPAPPAPDRRPPSGAADCRLPLPGAKRTVVAVICLGLSTTVAAVAALLALTTRDEHAIRDFALGCELPVLVLTGITFLMWFYNAHANLKLLGAGELAYSPGWAVGGFFVPFLNLSRPLQVAQEIWKASDPDARTSWSEGSNSALINSWWTCWLAAGLLGKLGIHAVSGGLTMAAGVLAILMILQIRQRQTQKYEQE